MKGNERVSKTEEAAADGYTPRLKRVIFRTSRMMDFSSEDELVKQTGHAKTEWPLTFIKEGVDNALDACEDENIPPNIAIKADRCGISIADNGPGLPESTLLGAMKFTDRYSSREAYVSPCRGAQGNALMTLIPMPYVLDKEQGKFIVTTQGTRHEITLRIDPISQQLLAHDDPSSSKSTNLQSSENRKQAFFVGTEIRLGWGMIGDEDDDLWPFSMHPISHQYLGIQKRIFALVEGFAVFNPHATITLDWFGKKTVWQATDPNWNKWKPHDPTSAYWYAQRHFERLIGAYITHDKEQGVEQGKCLDRLVSDFLVEFDGFQRSGKRTKVLTTAGLKRARLSEFVANGRFDSDRIALLLSAMRKNSKPVNPKRLGLIGEEHLKQRLLGMGVKPESFAYDKTLYPKSTKTQFVADEKSLLPWVVETAFGWLGKDAANERKIVTGANWSAAIKNPFRSFGATGEGVETLLSKFYATNNEPVVVVLHLACPRIAYTNRGKSEFAIGGNDE